MTIVCDDEWFREMVRTVNNFRVFGNYTFVWSTDLVHEFIFLSPITMSN